MPVKSAVAATLIRWWWAASIAILFLFLGWYYLAPDKVVLAEKRSPDGLWTVSVEETIFKSSVATPIKRIEIRKSNAWFPTFAKTNLLTFNQDDESENVGLFWQGSTFLEVHLPRSANGFGNKIENLDSLRIAYITG